MYCLRAFRMLTMAKQPPQVIKMDGQVEEFRLEKIVNSVWMAAAKVGGKDEKKAEE